MRAVYKRLIWLVPGLLLVVLFATACVHEEIKPIRETMLTVARAGPDATISWVGQRGMYYTVMYSNERGKRAKWHMLPDAINIYATVSGEPIIVRDTVPTPNRYYHLVQDVKPLVP